MNLSIAGANLESLHGTRVLRQTADSEDRPQEQARADAALLAFVEHAARIRQVSASTLEAYSLDMAAVFRWAYANHLDPLALSTAELVRYVSDRQADGLKASTLARQISSCRRFFGFLIERGDLSANPASNVYVPMAPPTRRPPLAEATLKGLFQLTNQPGRTPHEQFRQLRDHVMLGLLAQTSLGVSDVRLLRWSEVSLPDRVVRVRRRDGTWRSVLLGREVHGALAQLQKLRSGTYCFPGVSGLPLTRQALCHVVRKWAKDSGAGQALTPSALRQSGRSRRRHPLADFG